MSTDERLIVDVVASLKATTLVLVCIESEGGLSFKTFSVAKAALKQNTRDAFEYAGTALGSETLALSMVTLTVVEGVTTTATRAI